MSIQFSLIVQTNGATGMRLGCKGQQCTYRLSVIVVVYMINYCGLEWCKRKGDGQSNGGWSEGEETAKEGEGMLREGLWRMTGGEARRGNRVRFPQM